MGKIRLSLETDDPEEAEDQEEAQEQAPDDPPETTKQEESPDWPNLLESLENKMNAGFQNLESQIKRSNRRRKPKAEEPTATAQPDPASESPSLETLPEADPPRRKKGRARVIRLFGR